MKYILLLPLFCLSLACQMKKNIAGTYQYLSEGPLSYQLIISPNDSFYFRQSMGLSQCNYYGQIKKIKSKYFLDYEWHAPYKITSIDAKYKDSIGLILPDGDACLYTIKDQKGNIYSKAGKSNGDCLNTKTIRFPTNNLPDSLLVYSSLLGSFSIDLAAWPKQDLILNINLNTPCNQQNIRFKSIDKDQKEIIIQLITTEKKSISLKRLE